MLTPSETSFAGVFDITSGPVHKHDFQSLCTRCVKTARNGSAHAGELEHVAKKTPCSAYFWLHNSLSMLLTSAPWDGELLINAHQVQR